MELKVGGWYVKGLKLSKINGVKKEYVQVADDINEAKEFKDEKEVNDFLNKCKLLNYNPKHFEVVGE